VFNRTSQESIEIKKRQIDYSIRQSRRARRLRLAVYHDGRVVVSLPFWIPRSRARQYVIEKSAWLIEKMDLFKRLPLRKSLRSTKADFEKNKARALAIILARINYFNRDRKYRYNAVKIKNQKTQWGSCSRKRNLNFNVRVALLPADLRDYVIVHELCHLKEFNHSRKFWSLVAAVFPNYKQLIKDLKFNGGSLE
jgi:hypothetical protein